MRLGLLGFPKVGKTTLFNLLTGTRIAVDKFAAGRAQPHVGVARVPEPRLDRLAAMFNPRKTTFAQFDLLDIQGLQKGEAKDSLDLREVRNVDAVAHVVRAFRDPEIAHAEGAVDPRRDIETMEVELMLADLEVAQRRIERLELNLKKAKSKEDEAELPVIRRCLQALERETPIRALDLKPEEVRRIRGFAFLTAKPLLVIVNLDDSDASRIGSLAADLGFDAGGRRQTGLCGIAAKVEEEMAGLEPADARAFLEDLGLAEPARDRVIRAAFSLLGLVQFFTVGEDECRAWPVVKGSRAPQAAGSIHSDFEKGFIRAEVVPYDDLVAAGSLAAARERALLRAEGKDYEVRDGDVINFRFNV